MTTTEEDVIERLERLEIFRNWLAEQGIYGVSSDEAAEIAAWWEWNLPTW